MLLGQSTFGKVLTQYDLDAKISAPDDASLQALSIPSKSIYLSIRGFKAPIESLVLGSSFRTWGTLRVKTSCVFNYVNSTSSRISSR